MPLVGDVASLLGGCVLCTLWGGVCTRGYGLDKGSELITHTCYPRYKVQDPSVRLEGRREGSCRRCSTVWRIGGSEPAGL